MDCRNNYGPDQQEVMDYVVYLLGLISAYEKRLEEALFQKTEGADAVVLDDKALSERELAHIMLVLHFRNTMPDARAMERPLDHPAAVKSIIREKRAVLSLLGIPCEKSSKEVESWLYSC